jgi:hypothetical protein
VFAWKEKLGAQPEFAKEIAVAPDIKARMDAARHAQAQGGKTLEIVAEL